MPMNKAFVERLKPLKEKISVLLCIYKETGDSEERVDRFAKLIDGVSQSDILVLDENDCAAGEPFKIVTQGNKGEYWTQQYIGLLQITSDGTKEEVFIRSRFDVNESCEFSKYMLNKALGLKANILQKVEPSVGRGEILDLILAIIFAIQIARAYRKGIYRRYRTYENNDSKLKGRIDVARHIRLNPIFNGNIAYSSREYTADNDMNRMILTAYTSLQKRQPGLMRELEKKLHTGERFYLTVKKYHAACVASGSVENWFRRNEKNHACGIFGLGKCPENGNFDFKVYGNCARGRWDECQWYIN